MKLLRSDSPPSHLALQISWGEEIQVHWIKKQKVIITMMNNYLVITFKLMY